MTDINREKLSVVKFAHDLAVPGRAMAGTVYTPANAADRARGALVKITLLSGDALKNTVTNPATGEIMTAEGREYEDIVYRGCKGSLAQLRKSAGATMRGSGGKLYVFLSCFDWQMFKLVQQSSEDHECIHG